MRCPDCPPGGNPCRKHEAYFEDACRYIETACLALLFAFATIVMLPIWLIGKSIEIIAKRMRKCR